MLTTGRWLLIVLVLLWIGVVYGDDVPPDVTDWLKANAIPFVTDDPDADLSDLEPLSAIVGDVRIVGLGEATHGTAEFFRMKHRILRYLVEEEGFRVFMIEANMPESMVMNDYVVHGKGSARSALSLLHFWTWNTQEVLDMIEWMREWNVAHPDDPLYFYGFDAQFWAEGVATLLRYLRQVDPEYAKAIELDIYCFGDNGQQPNPTPECAEILSGIKAHYQDLRDDYIEKSNEFDYVIHQQVIESLIDVERLYSGEEDDYFNVRDEGMAGQVIAFAETIFPDERIVLWAHNVHMQSIPFDDNQSQSMGYHLREYYGDDYLNMGFAFNSGTFNAIIQLSEGRYGGLREMTALPLLEDSHEVILKSIAVPRYLLDMRVDEDSPAYHWLSQEKPFRVIGAVYDPEAEIEPFVMPMPLYGMFDVVIYFEDTTATTLLR